MASNNQLLGSGVEVKKEKKVVENKTSVKLYREDWKEGRVFHGEEMIAMMKTKNWREKPFEESKKPFEESKKLSAEDIKEPVAKKNTDKKGK